MSVFIPIPKKDNAKECSNYYTVALISHISKVMLKILQARLQQYVNYELPDVQVQKRQRNQRSNCQHPLDHAREFQKNIYFCFIDYAKAFDCVDPNKLWKSERDGNIRLPDLPLEKFVMQVRKQQLELDMEQQTCSKQEKEYVKAVFCHPAYLISMQSTS